MNRRTSTFGGFLLLVLIGGASDLHGQTDPQEATSESKPKPAARSIPSIDPNANQTDNEDLTNRMQPDTTPLTGIANASLGSSEVRHSYWVPGIQYVNNIQSNQYGQSTGWFDDNYVIGNISLLKAWTRSQLVLNYSGGGIFSTNSQQGNSWMQQLALAQTFLWNRWQVQLLDQFSYLPQSQFGFGGGTGLGIPGGGGLTGPTVPGIGGGYVPNQSIYASTGPRYSNASVAQITYQLTPRGSITASGAFGMLHFVDPGNVDSNSLMGSIGYNYQLTREDTIGLVYRYSNFQYPGEPQAFGDQIVNIAYGRKITGRLAFQVSGGPEFSTFRIPINSENSKLGGNLNVNLTYAFENGSISGGYIHGLSGGSGVFTGSTLDQVTFGGNRRLSRVWSGQANFGFAHNRAVSGESLTGSPSYNNLFLGAGVNRPIGRNLYFAVAYSANINKSTQAGCTGSSCSTSQTVNYITLSIQWQSRPLVLP